MKKNREAEERMARIRLVKDKLGEYDAHSSKKTKKKEIKNAETDKQEKSIVNYEILEQNNISLIGPKPKLDELRNNITDFPDFRKSVFTDKNIQNSREADKKKMREQFEL